MKTTHASFRRYLNIFLKVYLCCFAIILFIKFLSWVPVGSEVYVEAIRPLQKRQIGQEVAWYKAEVPIRRFMAERIERYGCRDTVIAFLEHSHDYKAPEVLTWRNVPWSALLPGFALSELKATFDFAGLFGIIGIIGVVLYTPFMFIDMVISVVILFGTLFWIKFIG